MTNVSILGCGWLGKATGKELKASGYKVSGSTTRNENFQTLEANGIDPYFIQLSPTIIGEHVESFFSTDILIISLPPRSKTGNGETFLQQIDNIRKEIIKRHVSKIIFISATSVYKNLNRVVVESDADVDTSLYQAEQILSRETSFKTTVIRFGGLVGPGRHPGKFLAGKTSVADGDAPVNIIHQQDCVEIIKNIIEQNVWGEIFNACSPLHPSRREFYTLAANALSLTPPQFIIEKEYSYKIISIEKLQQTLQYNFIFPDPIQMISAL